VIGAIKAWMQQRRDRVDVKLAAVFLARPHEKHFGYPLSQAAKLRSFAMYDALDRFLERGWIVDGWTDSSQPRRFYVLTTKGREEMPH